MKMLLKAWEIAQTAMLILAYAVLFVLAIRGVQ